MLGAPGAAAARAVAAGAGAANPLAGQMLGFGPLAASMAAVALMIGWQIMRGRWRDIRRRHRDAGLLGVELTLVAEMIRARTGCDRRPPRGTSAGWSRAACTTGWPDRAALPILTCRRRSSCTAFTGTAPLATTRP